MKKVLAFLLTAFTLFAQNNFAPAFDYAVFNFDDSSKYLELYYSFPSNEMARELSGEEEHIRGELNLTILKMEDSLETFYQNNWDFENVVNNNSATHELTGLISLQIPFGRYVLVASGKDLVSGDISEEQKFEILVEKTPEDIFSISDLEVAGNIVQFSENTNSIFYKSTLEVMPNPKLVFGKGLPVLYFYCEFYNLDKSKDSDVLRIDHQLLNSRNEVKYSKSKFVKRNSGSRVEIGAINIMDIFSGSYTLNVSLTDTVSNKSAYAYRKVYIYNPDLLDTTQVTSGEADILATEFSMMDEEELNFVFLYSKYIAAQSEINAWNDLITVEGKKNFLYEFWKKRDTNPSTPENEYRTEYLERLNYVNHEFSNMVTKEGFKTDRGRVYLMLGKPDDISRYPNESEQVPYEIWRYDQIESGVIFVFADYNFLGNYKQIHSNKRGEIYNRYWQKQINVENANYLTR